MDHNHHWHAPALDTAREDTAGLAEGEVPGICTSCLNTRLEAHSEGQIDAILDPVEQERAKLELIRRGAPFDENAVTDFLVRGVIRGTMVSGIALGLKLATLPKEPD